MAGIGTICAVAALVLVARRRHRGALAAIAAATASFLAAEALVGSL